MFRQLSLQRTDDPLLDLRVFRFPMFSLSVGLFVIAASIEIMLDVEENTRASFRLQQLILEELQETETPTADHPPA